MDIDEDSDQDVRVELHHRWISQSGVKRGCLSVCDRYQSRVIAQYYSFARLISLYFYQFKDILSAFIYGHFLIKQCKCPEKS